MEFQKLFISILIYFLGTICLLGQCDLPEDNCVYPGDTNKDGVVDKYDTFNIGLGYGTTGPPRDQVGIYEPFQAYPGDDWGLDFTSGVDYKHADCKGDGLIDHFDVTPIEIYYNNITEKKTTNIDKGFTACIDTAWQENELVAQIILGDVAEPVEDLYGVAFTLHYPTEIIDTISFLFWNTSWFLGDTDNAYVDLVHVIKEEGRVELAVVRGTQTNMDGFGSIGAARLVTIDNISGQPIDLQISEVRAISEDEVTVDFKVCPEYELVEIVEPTFIESNNGENYCSIFPNPTSDNLFIKNAQNIESWQVLNLWGQVLIKGENFSESGININTSNLPNGVYWVEVFINQGSFKEKVVIVK